MGELTREGSLAGPALAWSAIFIGLPALVAAQLQAPTSSVAPGAGAAAVRPPVPPPAVEPLEIASLDPVEARAINAAVPFSTAPNPPARPFRFAGAVADRVRATDCLAAAMIYEAGDDAEGERAVGQVVLNRLRHPAFPKTVCDVVFQGQERRTGCQFTFTCDGAMARIPNPAAWERARQLAAAMLAGEVYRPVGHATHYHTDWVVPYWSASLDKITAVGTHLFFRWQGWWGTPGAFARGGSGGAEPMVARLAALSSAHADAALAAESGPTMPGLAATIIDAATDARPAVPLASAQIGKRFGVVRLTGVEEGGTGYLLAIDRNADDAQLAGVARQLCGGRPLCRLMGWTSGAPKTFPIMEADLQRMSWSFLRRQSPAFERMLFNCAEFEGRPAHECMVDRTGALPRGLVSEPAAAPRAHVELVRLRPVAATAEAGPASDGGPGTNAGTPSP